MFVLHRKWLNTEVNYESNYGNVRYPEQEVSQQLREYMG